jgi:hypothetical protein
MANWKNNDREESKPSWLTPAQKINCVRTVKGWELPLQGSSVGGDQDGTKTSGITASVPHMELLVCLGATSTDFTRMVATGGATSSGDSPNFPPYITCPFNGDSATGPAYTYNGVAGLTFATSATAAGMTAIGGATGYGHFGVGAGGVSTLNFPGSTAYIKVVCNDSNFTQNITFSLPANTPAQKQEFGPSATILQGNALINGTIPKGVYEAFFGPTASLNNSIAVLQIAKAGATANSTFLTTVVATDNGALGLTAQSTFAVSFGAAATS